MFKISFQKKKKIHQRQEQKSESENSKNNRSPNFMSHGKMFEDFQKINELGKPELVAK